MSKKSNLIDKNEEIAIEIKNLTKIFSGKNKALNNVTLSFKRNKITGLIGFNGSGKTTTYNILSNFIETFKGKFYFEGKPFDKKIRREISYLSAGSEPKNPTKAKSHLFSIASLYDLPKVEAKKKIEEIAKKIEFTEFLSSPIKSLSKGNQQKIKVIASLLNPRMKYLFLDEPFDGLDPLIVEKIKKIYLELKNVTIIITSHRMDVVNSMCEEFYVLKQGALIDSKKTNDPTVIIEVNGDMPLTKIKKIKHVKNAKKKEKKILMTIDDINNFKEVNKKLIAFPEYVYSSIKDKDVASSVFEGYGI